MTRPASAPIGSLDLHLLDTGRHHDLHHVLGARPDRQGGVDGTRFAVWAPSAQAISVVGDWNWWSEGADPMARVDGGGIWHAFSPHAHPGQRYKLAVTGADGRTVVHADPLAFRCEPAPDTASIVHETHHAWGDDGWMAARASADLWDRPLSIYEVHLGSWRRDPAHPDRELGFRAAAEALAAHVVDLGFTHVELLPVMAHPFAGSWGYQVTSFFAPVARWGEPDDLKHLIDVLHQAGVGVLLDWVPAHFPKDEWALARFDGTPLYEHADPQRADHPDWGTFEFDFGRGGVRSFLLSSARFWIEEFHADGLRVDAVASMLHLDYSRAAGEWTPNVHGGREDLDAVSLVQDLNQLVAERHPGVAVIAEESTAWPGVTAPVERGGLGFDAKWNLGWMHDTLDYFTRDPIHRRHHHDRLTFPAHYAFDERFVLPLSHDEVVHGKRSLLEKMPGDRWQQLANLRSLLAWMWAHPGSPLLFMGAELAQEREWSHERSLDWHLLADAGHAGVQQLVRDLNGALRAHPALWSADRHREGFGWLEHDVDANVTAFERRAPDGSRLACIANLSPIPRHRHPIALPQGGSWREVLNTDASAYGGSGIGNLGVVAADGPPRGDQPASAEVGLPPLAVLWLAPG